MKKIILISLQFSLFLVCTSSTQLLQAQTTVSKSCGKCQKPVSQYATIGDVCPHCGVRWGYENTKQTKSTISINDSHSTNNSNNYETEIKYFVRQFLSYTDAEDALNLSNCYASFIDNFYGTKNISRSDVISSEKKYWLKNDYEKFDVSDITVKIIDRGYHVEIRGFYTKDYRLNNQGRAIIKSLKISHDFKIYYIKDTFIN